MDGQPPVSALDLDVAVETLRGVMGEPPRVAIVLGSGLGGLIERVGDVVEVPFGDLPGLPQATVSGHRGRFAFGSLSGVRVAVVAGRLHAYEGHDLTDVVAPIRILAELGVSAVILTNASGAIHPRLVAGDIVLIDDQINLTFRSALAGAVLPGDERFPDMSAPFDIELQNVARRVASDLGLSLHRGTYAGVLGPQYETASEVRMLAGLGADLVGMSTVPEVTVARAARVRVAGVSLVTNKATGLAAEELSHDDVLAAGAAAGERLVELLANWVGALGNVSPSERSD